MRSPSASAELQREDYQRQKEKLLLLAKTGGLADGQKRCFKCQTIKHLDDFYLHPQMADGRLGKCKECTKSDAAKRLVEKRDDVRQYESWRQKTSSRREKKSGYRKTYNQRHPEKARARAAVNNAIRDGRITRQPCCVCGNLKSQAHHSDYFTPLAVDWLCFKHHREIAHGQKVG